MLYLNPDPTSVDSAHLARAWAFSISKALHRVIGAEVKHCARRFFFQLLKCTVGVLAFVKACSVCSGAPLIGLVDASGCDSKKYGS